MRPLPQGARTPAGTPPAESPLRIAYVINWLNVGGAETVLFRLLRRLDRTAFRPEVICLTEAGVLAEPLRDMGIPVRALGMRRGIPDPIGLLRLAAWMRTFRPHLVHTWLYHADLIGGLANRLSVRTPLLWHLHNTLLPKGASKRTTMWTVNICARLSHWLPQRIACCAEAACRLHAEIGYAAEKMLVIPNGFDLETFRPDPAARVAVRAELGLEPATTLIGLVARWDPVKGHRTFVEAAAQLHAQRPDVHFVLCGAGVDADNDALRGWIDRHGLAPRVHLLGRREDMPRIYAALDLATSASITEALPNVVGEAMACAVPCVVTDVGDSALMVGETGRVVPPEQPATLAGAWCDLLALDPSVRAALGVAARRRVQEHYELGAIVARFESLYRDMIGHVRH